MSAAARRLAAVADQAAVAAVAAVQHTAGNVARSVAVARLRSTLPTAGAATARVPHVHRARPKLRHTAPAGACTAASQRPELHSAALHTSDERPPVHEQPPVHSTHDAPGLDRTVLRLRRARRTAAVALVSVVVAAALPGLDRAVHRGEHRTAVAVELELVGAATAVLVVAGAGTPQHLQRPAAPAVAVVVVVAAAASVVTDVAHIDPAVSVEIATVVPVMHSYLSAVLMHSVHNLHLVGEGCAFGVVAVQTEDGTGSAMDLLPYNSHCSYQELSVLVESLHSLWLYWADY